MGQVFKIDVIEHLDDWVMKLLLHPAALDQAVLDPFDSPVPLARIIIPGIDAE